MGGEHNETRAIDQCNKSSGCQMDGNEWVECVVLHWDDHGGLLGQGGPSSLGYLLAVRISRAPHLQKVKQNLL